MNNEQDIKHILLRRLQGFATVEENVIIEEWASLSTYNMEVLRRLETEDVLKGDLAIWFKVIDSADAEVRLQRMHTQVLKTVNLEKADEPRQIERIQWKLYFAAAAILIVLGIGSYFYKSATSTTNDHPNIQVAIDIPAGGNRAILTLEDGSKFHLSEEHAGIVVGDEITYQDGSLIAEDGVNIVKDNKTKDLVPTLKLTTPRGGTYQVMLPDGTHVWLNAGSTLKYPSRFPTDKRVVELEGEAFFSVKAITTASSSNSSRPVNLKNIPFNVITKEQNVEVLGTAFNISAYPEVSLVKTTLVEGSVRVNLLDKQRGQFQESWPPVVIKPGEQATVYGKQIKVTSVDTLAHTAWKDGLFYFRRTSVEEIMQQIARWYDVDIVYRSTIPKETISGKLKRNVSLMGVLDILKTSSINVRLEGNRLIVD